MTRRILFAAAGLALCAAPLLRGQVQVNIPFDFTANHHLHRAGEYVFKVNIENRSVEVISRSGSKGMEGRYLPFVTMLAPANRSPSPECRVVFDKTGDTYTLTQIWPPEANGILVHASKGAHEHHMIRIPHR